SFEGSACIINRMLSLQIFWLAFGLVTADSPSQDPSAYMKQIWSPYCKGVSLMECPSSQAERLRNEIYERMKQGEAFESIYADLAKRYGSTLRMSPEFEGRESAAFLIPWIMAIATAIFVLAFWMTRKQRKIAATVKSYKAPSSLESRIQDELEDLR